MSDTQLLSVPQHVGIILDGNRRWAKAHGLPSFEGHRQGADVLKKMASAAFQRGVKYLSAFVFSTENWSRTQEEVSYLMGLVRRVADKYLDEVHKEGIRLVVIGSREGLDKKVLQSIERCETKTAHNTKGTMALCFNYGGQQEVVDAAKTLIKKGIKAAELTVEKFANALYAPDVPPIDLLIRTSGEHRLSGYMMWRAAYAELHFTDKFWPDSSEPQPSLS